MASNDDFDLQKHLQELFKKTKGTFVYTGEPEHKYADHTDEMDEDAQNSVLEKIRSFKLKPREITDALDHYVISQNEAKKVLSVAICDHYNHVRQCLEEPDLQQKEYVKPNVLLLGPTGVGKTYLIRCIARLIGVPFVKADATKFSETGYVGYDVEDIVRDLVKLAGGNHELAQYGIVFIDEVDKIASRGNEGARDVSGRGVQVNLLKLMEDTEVKLVSQADILGQMQAVMAMQSGNVPKQTISTRHMLIIMSGAFEKLPDLIQRRLGSHVIGFNQSKGVKEHALAKEYLSQLQTSDLVEFGFEPEFAGRLPVRVALNALSAQDLENILRHAQDSILEQYRQSLEGFGIKFTIDDEAVTEIAEQAHTEKTGARGLVSILEKTFREFKYHLPSTGITEFNVSVKTVREPKVALKDLLKVNETVQQQTIRQDIEAFCERLQSEHGFEIRFTPAAMEELLQEINSSGRTPRAYCEEKFHDFEFGLILISRNTGKRSFSITKAAVLNPDKTISKWITESYKPGKKRAQ